MLLWVGLLDRLEAVWCCCGWACSAGHSLLSLRRTLKLREGLCAAASLVQLGPPSHSYCSLVLCGSGSLRLVPL